MPHLLFFTDPRRTPDIEAVARTLPAGAAIVFRPFGARDAEVRGRRLMALARARKLILLVGGDEGLARLLGAHGVHLPERSARRAGQIKRAHPGWIVTVAAHSLGAARRAHNAGGDAAVVSTVFASRSASAAAPMGPIRLAKLVRDSRGLVYALGGINDKTACRLLDVGLVGVAAVEGL